MALKCDQCGAAVKTEGKFCPYCGAKLPEEEKVDIKERKISIESTNHTRIRLAEIRSERQNKKLEAKAAAEERAIAAEEKRRERDAKSWKIIFALFALAGVALLVLALLPD